MNWVGYARVLDMEPTDPRNNGSKGPTHYMSPTTRKFLFINEEIFATQG